jgi:voltage-gated potassium channel
MVIITIFGVGYGEVRPIVDPGLRVFTMIVIVVGCVSLIYVTGGFIQMVTEGEIEKALGTRRRTKGIDRLSGHAIICGFGRVGRILADELARVGQAFVVVDANADRIKEAEAAGYLVITGNATEEKVLEGAGVRRARVLASVLPDDAANVFITLTARELNAELEIVARAENAATERKLITSGATRVVLPSVLGARRISRLITNPSIEEILTTSRDRLDEDFASLGLRLGELELAPSTSLIGARVADVEFGGEPKAFLVALIRKSGDVLREPPPDAVLEGGDRVLYVTNGASAPRLRRRPGTQTGLQYRGTTVK